MIHLERPLFKTYGIQLPKSKSYEVNIKTTIRPNIEDKVILFANNVEHANDIINNDTQFKGGILKIKEICLFCGNTCAYNER